MFEMQMGLNRQGQVVITNVQGDINRAHAKQTHRDQMKKKKAKRDLQTGRKKRRPEKYKRRETKKEMISEQMTHYQESA